MNRKTDDEIAAELMKDGSAYSLSSEREAALERIKQYESEEYSPNTRFLAYLTHARCALDAGDLLEAMSAMSSVDRNTLSEPDLIFADKMLIEIYDRTGKTEQAKILLQQNLAKPEILAAENRGMYYEMLGLMGSQLTKLGEYEEALKYFEKGSKGFERGVGLDGDRLNWAFCLKMLNRDEEAESCLKLILYEGSGAMLSDTFWALGTLYWKMGRSQESLSMLQLAADNISHGTIPATDVESALTIIRNQIKAPGN